MSLDFPSNPADGQVYDGYYYDAAIGVWQSNDGTQIPNIFKNAEYTTAQTYLTPLTVKGKLGQTADLQQWKDSSGDTLASIDDEGGLTLGNPLPISSGGTGSEVGINLVPTGCIMMWYTDTPPSGWILCNGQSTSSYPQLAAIVGASVPNLQGRVPVGKDSTQTEFDELGETGGAKATSLSEQNIPQHSHSINHDHASFNTASGGAHRHLYFMDDGASIHGGATRYNTVQYDASSGPSGNGGFFYTQTGDSNFDGTHSHAIDVPAFTGISGNYGSASVTPVTALQPYLVINYIIKT
jgi:microcystin-dependent protein